MSGEAGSAAPRGYGLPPPGFRLPPEAAPGRVRLQVADLARSLDYYGRVLGLRRIRGSDGVASLAPRGASTPLIELRERPGATAPPPGGRLGLFHFAVLLPERASLGRFARHLGGMGLRHGASDHGVSEALYLRDPDGLGIEVYADRPRSAWRTRGRELVMVTEPLDRRSLLRAGGEEEWDGVPSGAVIGHVHLHVGDLDRAEAFYHVALGLDKVVWSYPGALFLSAGGYHHHLGVHTWAAGAEPAGDAEARLLEWELVLPSEESARAALEHLAAASHRVAGVERGGIVRDPWGTAVRVRAA